MELQIDTAKNNVASPHEMIQHNVGQPAAHNLAPRVDWSEMSESEHFVQFYESDAFLLNSLSGFIGTGLKQGDACIVVATKAHREGLAERLEAYGLDLAAAHASGQYFVFDADETLSKLMDNGSPEPGRFVETIGSIVAQAAQGRSRVRIFGEMVALLWAEGNYEAAISLEEFWNDLQETRPFSLFCAYPMKGCSGESLAKPFGHVCAKHTRVIPDESYTALQDSDDRLRAIILLQQKARSLQAEIVERKRVQEALHRREAELTDFIENAIIGLHWVGADGIIQWANQAEMDLLGYTREEYFGHHIAEFHADQDVIADILARLSQGEELHSYEAQLRAKDGSIRHVLISSNVYHENGEFIHTRCFTRDITGQKRIEEISSHLAAIVESSDDAIISKTLEGIILSWNNGAEHIFGYTAEEAVGKPIQILIPPDRLDEEPRILEQLKRGERIDHYDTVRLTKDGREIDISLSISPIKDRSGKVIAASKIARDITERKRAELEREQLLIREQMARAEAESANRMKDEFLATVSHELRTPLNAIIGWAHMLRDGGLDEDTVTRAVETIERNAKSQAQLIEDILDVSRAVTGKLRLSVGSVDAASVINAAIDAVQLAADSKGIQLEVTLDPSARHISGDASRLQQVVWNLLSNAIKFTPPGGRIEVRLERAGSDAEISISDTGCGINPDFLPFVFDRFRQADGSSTRRHGGLGLGLAIVRHLVELHGGTVHADSPGEGGGSTFTIRLPLTVTTERAKNRRQAVESVEQSVATNGHVKPLPSLDGVQVLLVDDDPDSLQMLTAMLTEQKAGVEAVASAADAFEMLQWYRPDVLVSDLAMPDEDGYSLITKVRSFEMKNGRKIRAIALTAYVRIEDRARALAAGFNMFVPKPVEPSELITAIANLAESSAVKVRRT